MFRSISFATLEIEKVIKLVFLSSLDASTFQKYSFRRKISYIYIRVINNFLR